MTLFFLPGSNHETFKATHIHRENEFWLENKHYLFLMICNKFYSPYVAVFISKVY